MQYYSNVRGTQLNKPAEVEILDKTVYVRKNIKKIHEFSIDDLPDFEGWEYDEIIYDKDEYIAQLAQTQRLEAVEMALLGLLLN